MVGLLLNNMWKNQFSTPIISDFFNKNLVDPNFNKLAVTINFESRLILGKSNIDFRLKNHDISSSSIIYKPLPNLELNIFGNGRFSGFYESDNLGMKTKLCLENKYVSIGRSFNTNNTDVDIYVGTSENVSFARGFFKKESYASGFSISLIGKDDEFNSLFYALKYIPNTVYGIYWKLPFDRISLLFSHEKLPNKFVANFSLRSRNQIFFMYGNFFWKQMEFKGIIEKKKKTPCIYSITARYNNQILHFNEPNLCLVVKQPITIIKIAGNLRLPKLGTLVTGIHFNLKGWKLLSSMKFDFFCKLDPISLYETI